MKRGLWLVLGTSFAIGVGCGGSVSESDDLSGGGSSGATGTAGAAGTGGAPEIDCTSLGEPDCAGENACVAVWRNDQIVEMAGPPPPELGGSIEDPCCIGCEEPECVGCHQPRFVGCRLRASACKQLDGELCGYLEADACAAE
ncbi:MAG: hypothetical protein KC766_12760 [Myxococcales bacterium]|nr:hypothetical protein [Myxococcales bacterium]